MKKTNYDRIGESIFKGTLQNGLTVWVVPKEHHAKSYAFFATKYGGMDLRFQKNGAWLDTPAGIAHYLEHKMFDTKEGNALQELAKNGAEPNAFTSNAITAYYFDSTEHFEENLKILLRFVSVPYFTKKSVEKERDIIGQEIRMIEDNPEWQVYTRLMQCLYRTSSARVSVAGTVASIAEITPETLYDCHRAFYTPSNMILVVVGNVDAQRVLDIAFELLPRESAKPAILRDYGEEESADAFVRETKLEMEVSMPMFLAGFKCAPPKTAGERLRESLIGDIACELLLGDGSPLYTKLYNEGLVNGSFGGCYETMPGVAYLYAGGDSRDPKAVEQAILAEAARYVNEGIDETYYQQICRADFGETLRALNSFENIAVSLAEGYFAGYDAFRFAEAYETVRKEDIVLFLKENIVQGHAALSMVTPKEAPAEEDKSI